MFCRGPERGLGRETEVVVRGEVEHLLASEGKGRLLRGIDLAQLPPRASLFLLTAMIGVSLGLATLSYRFVEVTGRRWLRKRLDVRPGGGVGQGDALRLGGRA